MAKAEKTTKTEKKDIAKHIGTIFKYDGTEYKVGDAIPYDAWKSVISTHQLALAMNFEEFKDLDETIKDLSKQLKQSEPELRSEVEDLKNRLKYVVRSVEAFAISLQKAIEN